jgi:catechol 2,3-dioxygenase-like lactoylglutathione lyase family enzyme
MKSLTTLLALAVLAGAPAHAQSPKQAVPWKPVEGAFFALSVADLAASTAWYEEKLGLAVTLRVPPQGGAAVTVLEGGGLTVELLQLDQARPLSAACPGVADPLFVHGIGKVGFVVKDFDGVVAELRARGVAIAYGPFPARDGQRANVIIRDNAGNLIQLFGR